MYRPVGQHYYQPESVAETILPISNNERLAPDPNRYCQPHSHMFEYLNGPSLAPTDMNLLFPVNQFIHLVELSPHWDWEEGGTTVLLIFPQPLSTNTLFYVNFGNIQVNGEFITPTVLRCKSPPRPEGIYSVTVNWNQTHQITHGVDFEYKKNFTTKTSK